MRRKGLIEISMFFVVLVQALRKPGNVPILKYTRLGQSFSLPFEGRLSQHYIEHLCVICRRPARVRARVCVCLFVCVCLCV